MSDPAAKPAASPSGAGPGGRPMTPSERARHAANVRYGKENPFAARLAAIREKRKGKGKGKGKKPAKTPEQRASERAAAVRANLAKVRQAMVDGDQGIAPHGFDNLTGLAQGKEPDKVGSDALIKMGLAERGKDGVLRMSAAGKQAVGAAVRGDAKGAIDAISRAGDKAGAAADKEKAKADKEKAKEAAPKGGGGGGKPAKPSAADKKKEQSAEREKTAATTAKEVGLKEGDVSTLRDAAETGGAESAALSKLGLIGDDGTATDQGRRALSALERGDARGYRAALQDAQARMERETAARQRKDTSERAKGEREKATAERDTARAARDKERAARQSARDARQATRDKEHADDRAARLARAKKDMDMDDELKDILAALEEATNAASALPALDAIKAGKRNSGGDQGLIDQGYELAEQLCDLFEALGADTGDEQAEEAQGNDLEADMAGEDEAGKAIDETVYGSEIKALEGNQIGGFAVLFGDASTPDMSVQRDYFTKATDYWLDRFGWPRPMTYHHGMDEDTKDDPIVGTWTKAVVKDEGIWLEGQLDRAHRYHGAIKELVKRGFLKLSSDSAPQWVVRQRQPNGTNEVKRWPLITASPTVTPAEPRLASLSLKAILAELGDAAIDHDSPEVQDEGNDRPDGAKVADDRARKLLLRSKLIALQE